MTLIRKEVMILKIRVDDRLLHGQVAYSWKAKLGYEAIVIASKEASLDEFRKATLKMCCPQDVKLATKDVEGATKLLNNPKLKDMKVFVICPDPKTVYDLVCGLDEKPTINLGAMAKKDNSTLFSKALYMNEEDKSYCDKLIDLGYEIEIQEVPETSAVTYKK